MIQIILIVAGLALLILGKLKVSNTKTVSRPLSIYWGVILIAYGVALRYLPETLTANLAFYGSLLIISFIFISKSNTVPQSEVTASSKGSLRNLIILIIFGALLIAGVYFHLMGSYPFNTI